MNMYFAGEGYGKSCDFIYGVSYNRLLSYINNRTRAEKYIFNKRWEQFMKEFIPIHEAGDRIPERLENDFTEIIDYVHIKGSDDEKKTARFEAILEADDNLNREIRGRIMDLYLSGMEKMGTARVNRWITSIEGGDENMDLYLVGPEKENIMEVVTSQINSNMLFNYIDGKKATDKYKERIKPKKLFIDSGAFSAWTKGKVIDVDEYINWINERSDYIDLYAQVDVIPGDILKGHTQEQVEEAAQATWENYLYMRPKMNKPEGLLYTFHVGEPFRYLEQALEWRDENGNPIPYMALGGMVGKPMPVKKSFLDTCFKIIKKSSNPNIKIHAFGMTSFPLLEQYPITSADSTSWIMTGANGNIMTDAGIIAVSDQMAKLPTHYSHLPKHHQEEFQKTIEEFGFTLDELRESRDNRIMFNARYMHKKASNLEYKPGPQRQSLF